MGSQDGKVKSKVTSAARLEESQHQHSTGRAGQATHVDMVTSSQACRQTRDSRLQISVVCVRELREE